jgi:hypothetical protein
MGGSVLEREIRQIGWLVKSPSAALRFTFVAAAYHPCTPHSSGFARLASGAFYAAIALATFYEIIKFDLLGDFGLPMDEGKVLQR